MNIVDRIRDRIARARLPEPDQQQAMANFQFPNRHDRRKMGFKKPIGLISEQHVGLVVVEEANVPRYARRHYKQMGYATRRARKATARIMRLVGTGEKA